MCLCIVLKVYGGHKYLFSFNIKASNIEWVLNCDTYSPCSLGVPIYPSPLPLCTIVSNFQITITANYYCAKKICTILGTVLNRSSNTFSIPGSWGNGRKRAGGLALGEWAARHDHAEDWAGTHDRTEPCSTFNADFIISVYKLIRVSTAYTYTCLIVFHCIHDTDT